jgi:hypothetical protein
MRHRKQDQSQAGCCYLAQCTCRQVLMPPPCYAASTRQPSLHPQQQQRMSVVLTPAIWPSCLFSGTEMRFTLCSAHRASISFL